ISDWLRLPASEVLVDACVKAGVLLALTSMTAFLLRHKSAAVRHRLWCLGICGVVILPVLSLMLPQWRLPLLPATEAVAVARPTVQEDHQPNAHLSINEPRGEQRPVTGPRVLERNELAESDSMSAFANGSLTGHLVPDPPSDLTTQLSEEALPTRQKPSSAQGWFIGAWLVGLIIVLIPFAFGLAANLWMLRRSKHIRASKWTRLADQLAAKLLLTRRVTLLEARESVVPMTWGVVRPIVLLPSESNDWSDERRRFVLLHEFAHVKRLDVLFQSIARLACALYWFNPLAWYALWRLRVERELACDDCVVASGERPTDYASQLLQIARAYRPARFSVGVAMARSTKLEQRIVALLDRARSHVPVGKQLARTLLAAACVLVLGMSVIGLGEQSATSASPAAKTLARRDASETPTATEATKVAQDGIIAAAKSAANARAQPVRTIQGRVLDPNGRPVAGATISVPQMLRYPPRSTGDVSLKQKGRTDQEGCFDVRTAFAGFPSGIKTIPVIAYAKGFGAAWQNLSPGEDAEDVTLRLTKDEPIRGRVVDTEGRPVADARIDVMGLLQEPSGSLDGFLEAWKNDWNIAPMRADLVHAQFSSFLGTKSDKNGEFEIRGVGLERIALVEMRHAQIASTRVWVVNRPGLDTKPYNDAAQLRLPAEIRRPGMVPLLVGPKFDHVVEAGRTIEGVIYVGKDREPVAGAVVATVLGYGMGASDVTDERGAYAIEGVGHQSPHFVIVRPPEGDKALLQRTVSTSLPAGQRTVKIDVELVEGALITGRVTDPATGKGVPAGIRVVPLPGNKYFDDPLYDVYKRNQQQSSAKADGTFRIVTIPGPSVVMAQVHYHEKMGDHDVTPFRQASFSAEDEKHVPLTVDGNDRYFTKADGSIEVLGIQNAVRYVNLKPDGEAAHVDLVLDRGKKVEIEIHDDNGKPIKGVFAAGVTEHWPHTFRLTESRSTVYGLGEDRPRTLMLLHPDRKLAGSVTLKGDETSPVVVKLAPAGSISGRAVDDGAPLSNVKVDVNFSNNIARELYRFSDLKTASHTTDAEGRFRIDNLVPGERFVVDFQEGDSYFRAILKREERTAESGKVREYNDLKIRKLR
ncbi:MAG: M56 family metallopeptidase, partial [Pirellulaceae bacterium]|nr:M56 family metallopeptidase [Pirellulaceae bacterium]